MSVPRRLRDPRAALRAYVGGEAVFPIAVLFALNVVDEFDLAAFNLLGPEIADHFGVGVGAIGGVSLLVMLMVPLLGVPIAYLADRRRRMPLALAGATVWGLASLATGFAPTMGVLIALRMGSAAGKAVNDPVHGALIADYYSPATRARVFSLHSVANPAGALVAAVVGGFLGDWFGWRAPFLALAVPTFFLLLVARRLREPERGTFEVVEQPEAPPWADTFRRLWAVRSLRFQWIGMAFTAGSTLGLGVLVPFYLRDEFGVRPGPRGVLLGVGTAVSAAAILLGAPYLQRRFNESASGGFLWLCRLGVAAGVVLVMLAFTPALAPAIVMIWFVQVVLVFVVPGLRTVTAAVSPPEIRASAFAFGQAMTLAGAGFALIAFVVGEQGSVRWAIGIMAPVFLRGVAFFFKAARYLDDDIERLQPGHAERASAGPGLDADGAPVLLEVSRLTMSYGGVRVLFGVDLEVRAGEMVALLGTNGAGKSTTLNGISGLMEPDGGNVWFQGQGITGLSPERIARDGLVQVPGGKGVFPGLTVEENLRMGAFLLARDRALTAARIGEVVELFPRLGERLGQRAGSLSGGERQMLTLAQSFLLKPRLLLIDELSLGLAPAVVQELLVAVRAMNAGGVSMLLVEQSVNVALTLADRAYFLEKGEVRFSGATRDLLARPDLLRSVFLEGAAAGVGGTGASVD